MEGGNISQKEGSLWNGVNISQREAVYGRRKYITERSSLWKGVNTRGYQKVLSLRHFPHSDSTMLHT